MHKIHKKNAEQRVCFVHRKARRKLGQNRVVRSLNKERKSGQETEAEGAERGKAEPQEEHAPPKGRPIPSTRLNI